MRCSVIIPRGARRERHLFPMLPLALARRDAGHDVVVATGAPFLDRLPMRTVPGLPTEVDLPWAGQEVRRRSGGPGGRPDNVHVERFVPQPDVLEKVDLVVHHGGTGTVLAALEAGLLRVILPQGADQPFNADLIAGAGAGRRQANDDDTPARSPPWSSRCWGRAPSA